MHNGCYHDFPSKFFIITVPKNFVPETFVFQKMSGSEKNLKKYRVREMSHFFVGKYLSHSAENFRKEPFEVSEKLEYRKVLCIMGLCQDFPLKIFSFTVPRNFVGEPFCVSENFLYGRK